MNKQHDCSEVISRVFLALDGELDQNEVKDFMDDLNRCSWCLEHYNIEKVFKEFLCNKLQRKEVKPDVISEIKSKIRKISIE